MKSKSPVDNENIRPFECFFFFIAYLNMAYIHVLSSNRCCCGICYLGKWWGDKDKRPILCIHGWKDNSGSFDTLMNLLVPHNMSFLCIDLPGHGLSSQLPKARINPISHLIFINPSLYI